MTGTQINQFQARFVSKQKVGQKSLTVSATINNVQHVYELMEKNPEVLLLFRYVIVSRIDHKAFFQ